MKEKHVSDKPETSVSEQHTDETATQGKQVAFSPEQQKLINKLVDKATARQARKHREELAKVQVERDAAATGAMGESDLVNKLRQERDAAQERIRDMERARSESIAASAFTKAWKAAGLPDDEQFRKDMRILYTRIGDDGEITIVDTDSRERHGMDLSRVMSEVREKYYVSPSDANPRIPSGGNGSGKAKEDFTRAEKIDYIAKFGLVPWEKLPLSNKPRNTGGGATREADFARNWSNEKKAAYMKEHGSLALSQLLAKEREENR